LYVRKFYYLDAKEKWREVKRGKKESKERQSGEKKKERKE